MDWARLLGVFIVVLFTSSGQLLLRLVMRNFGMTGDSLGQLIGFALRTPLLWLAIALYGFSTLLWMRVLARYPVGSVYPMVAIGYLLVTLGGTIFLGERVPLQGWVALTIICFGTLLLAATPWQNSN